MSSAGLGAGRPAVLLVGGDQQRLGAQSSDIGGRFGIPEHFDQRADARELRIVVDQDQVRIPHTVSASRASYSRWAPKNRIGEDPGSILQRRNQPKVVSLDVERDCAIARAARSATRLSIASARP
jgi:hypothetical protein